VVAVGAVGLVQAPEEVAFHADQMADQPLDVEVPDRRSAPIAAAE
jgi:hypothetical protein